LTITAASNKMFDPIIEQAAAEIGWRAAKFATQGLKDEQV